MAFDGMWAGFGFESGGEIIFGLGQQKGILWSVQDAFTDPRRTRWCTFQQESASVGLGLGGSGGINFIVGYNAAVPEDFDRASGAEFDFSIDLALGKLDKYFRNLPELIELAAIGRKFDPNLIAVANSMKKYENSRVLKAAIENLAKNQSSVFDTLKGEVTMLSFPIPGAGGGLRLSIKMKAESTSVLSFGTMDFSA